MDIKTFVYNLIIVAYLSQVCIIRIENQFKLFFIKYLQYGNRSINKVSASLSESTIYARGQKI